MITYVRFSAVLLAICLFWSAEGQITVPLLSPKASVSTVVGVTEISINYFRPQMRDRKIFGDGDDFLVPYGKIWRTGANSGTKISFSDDVRITGKTWEIHVPKGEYLIFTWPRADSWTISFYKDLKLGGNVSKYDKESELIRFDVPAGKLAEKVETFTIEITDIKADNTGANVRFLWENVAAQFAIEVSYEHLVMSAIKNADMNNPSSLVTAAKYYYEKKIDLKKALTWINKYLKIEDKDKEFWNIHVKARIQKELGDKKNALKTAKHSLEVAQKANNDFYIKKNEDFIKSL